MRRLAAIAVLALAGLSVPVAAFWPYAAAVEQRRTVVVQTVAASPIMQPWVIPRGTHYFNRPLVIEDMDGVTWRGYGASAVTRLVYNGPPTKAFIQIIGSGRCRLQDFEIAIAVPGVEYAVLICNLPTPNPNGRISNGNVVENVRVIHGPAGGDVRAKYAFGVDSTAMSANYSNNEHHKFIRCYAQHYSLAGFTTHGTQAHQLLFDGCVAHDAGFREENAVRYGLHCRDGSYFKWVNGTFTGNSVDIKVEISNRQNVVQFCSSESSVQAYVCDSVGGSISIDNWRFDGVPDPAKPVVKYYGTGEVSIRDSQFSGINGVCPKIVIDGPLGGLGSFDMSGVMMQQHAGTQPAGPIVTVPVSWATRLHGVKWQRINENGTRTDKPVAANKGLPGVIP